MSKQEAYVSNIQRYSIHDGPGIRTVLFFLGCPLHCAWCQNPETINPKPVLLFDKRACIGCQECKKVCPSTPSPSNDAKGFNAINNECTICGACAEICSSNARKLSGKSYSIPQLVDEIEKDRAFYNNTSGGVTFSGGEPLMQGDFLLRLIQACKAKGIHTAIETTGHASWKILEPIAKNTDLFLYDIKAINSAIHKKYTGVDNKLILENLQRLARTNKVVIRIPLVPGVNNSEEEYTKILEHCQTLPNVDTIHILPFHKIGSSKYEELNQKWEFEDVEEQDDFDLYTQLAEQKGFFVSIGGADYKKAEKPPQKTDESTPKRKYFIY